MNTDTADQLADAARYAVLCRLMPVLRHDVAGAFQAPRMLLMVMEKRLQAAEPDLQAIAENVRSISALTRQATTSCMAVLGWMTPREDAHVKVHASVDEIGALLAMELSVHALTLVNSVENTEATAPQNFLRSVLAGALLAFCDQHPKGGTLLVTFQPAAADGLPSQLHLQLQTDVAEKMPELHTPAQKPRVIDWPDVQAMAQSGGVQMARGDGWLTMDLP